MPVVLCSGGIDSIVLGKLAEAHPECYGKSDERTLALYCDIGAATADAAFEIVKYHFKWAKRVKIPLPVKLRKRLSTHQKYYKPLWKRQMDYDFSNQDNPYLSADYGYVPCRSLLFLSMGVLYASTYHLSSVLAGWQFDAKDWAAYDANGYLSDIDSDFLNAYLAVLKRGGYDTAQHPVTVRAPFLETRTSKREIVAVGRSMGLDMRKTYSCEYFPPCYECPQCMRAQDALKKVHYKLGGKA